MTIATPKKPSPVMSEPAWEIAKLFPPQGQWSEGDYLALNTNQLVELSDGTVEVLEMATEFHQAIVGFLYEMLLMFVRAQTLGTVRFSPRPVKLWEGKFREPDVLFLKIEHDARRHNEYWDGADLVMEVVSDNDRRRDLDTKRFEYARGGIPEYWIVDPLEKRIAVLTLEGDHYKVAGEYIPGQRAMSVVLSEFSVEVTDVFAAK